jgi:protein TonB
MQILFSLLTGSRVVQHSGQVSWTTAGLVSTSVHALTAVLLFVGWGGVFPLVQVFPTQRREPTIDISSLPMEPDESVDSSVDFSQSATATQTTQVKPPPKNRAAETPMAKRPESSSVDPAKSPMADQVESAEQIGQPQQLRQQRHPDANPTMTFPSRSLPSSIGQTGAESKLPPVKIFNPAPQFPVSAIGKSGTVHLMIVVSRSGSVVDVEIEKSSGVREFDEAAIAAVRKWRFLPALEATTGSRRCRQRVEFLAK